MTDSLSLTDSACTPCRGGIPPLDETQVAEYHRQTPSWAVCDGGRRIERRFSFKDFVSALGFVQQVAEIAEAEQHHPDITFGWGYATISLQTHAIQSLHANDFIVAAKVDRLSAGSPGEQPGTDAAIDG